MLQAALPSTADAPEDPLYGIAVAAEGDAELATEMVE
jgi:hypothetical protein